MSPKEPVVTEGTPMPKGYGFLRKGSAYLTSNVRRKTHAAKRKLYVVRNQSKNLGLRAPKWILKEVFDEERATREKRRNEVQRRDGANEKEFESAIRTLFPRIPDDQLQKVMKRALEKRSGRVGRTKLLAIDQKAKLAVTAHIRHCHTKYESLVRGPMSRQKARDVIQGDLTRILGQWRGPQAAVSPRRQRKMDSRRASASEPRDLSKKLQSQSSRTNQVTNQVKRSQQKQQLPLPQKGGLGRSTRASARLKRIGSGERLEILDVFIDEEEEDKNPKSSDESQDEEEGDPNGLYEGSSDELSDDTQDDSENDFAEEWDID